MKPSTYDRVKRIGDIVVAGTGLALSVPVQLLVAGLVRVKLGSPVLFRQDRPGMDERIFTLVKFRTMLEPDPTRGMVTNEDRLTPFGHLLRSTSLDELPSLFNVLRGDMSIVGPRPLRVSYLPRYSRHHARRHEVRPGLTGLAQVRGRNSLSWDARLDLDVDYIEKRSMALDLRILLETLRPVISRTGIAEDGHAAMSEFMGSGPRLACVPLSRAHLPRRVAWLNDERVRRGITITFDARLDDTIEWYERITSDASRADFVCVDGFDRPASMFGITGMVDGRGHIYLYVDPERQSSGVGRRTMVHVLKEAEKLGIRQLHLEVKESNTAAVRLYERFGFRLDSKLDADNKLSMSRSAE